MQSPEPLICQEVTNAAPVDRRALIQDAVKGDEAAREALYRWAFPAVHRFFHVRTGAAAETTADLSADVFVKAFGQLPRLKDPDAFWPWLMRIAQNRLVDHQRRAIRHRTAVGVLAADPSDVCISPAEEFERADESDRLKLLLTRLGPEQQEALRLRFLEEFSLAEIGNRLGRSAKAVESLLARAREALRKEWKRIQE